MMKSEAEGAPGPAHAPDATAGHDRRVAWLAAAALLVAGAVWGTAAQRPWVDPDREPTGRDWWLRPRVANRWASIARLPRGRVIVWVGIGSDGAIDAAMSDGSALSSPDGFAWSQSERAREPGDGGRGPRVANLRASGDVLCWTEDLAGRTSVVCQSAGGRRAAWRLEDGIFVADLAVARDGVRVVAVGNGGAFVRSLRDPTEERSISFAPLRPAAGAEQRPSTPPANAPPSGTPPAKEPRSKEPTKKQSAPPRRDVKAWLLEAVAPSAWAAEPPARPATPPTPSRAPAALRNVAMSDDGRTAWAVGPGVVARLLPEPRAFTPEELGITGQPELVAVSPSGSNVWIAAGGPSLWSIQSGGTRATVVAVPPGSTADAPEPTALAADEDGPLVAGGTVGLALRRDAVAIERAGEGGPSLTVTAIAVRGPRVAVVLDGRLLLVSDDRGATFRRAVVAGSEVLGSIESGGGDGWIATSGGEVLSTEDGGASWTSTQLGTSSLVSLRLAGGAPVASDGRSSWRRDPGGRWTMAEASGEDRAGLAAATRLRELRSSIPAVAPGTAWASPADGFPHVPSAGEPAALRLGVPRRFPAPWFYLALLAAVGCAAKAMQRPRLAPAGPASVATLLVSDRPIDRSEQDVLGMAGIVEAVVSFIRNRATVPPVTFGITGEWGTGKSSILNMVEGRLRELGHVPIPFNAWHHESEQDVLSPLFATIIDQSGPRGIGWIEYRVRLLYRRWTGRSAGRVLVLGGAVVLALVIGGYVGANPGVAGQLLGIVGAVRDDAFLERLTQLGGGLASVALVVRLVKDLRPYGVDVAKLASAAAGTASTRDRRAQLGFRARFARDFADVAWAHGDRRLVLLVDDLDRCQPENAVRVLETVNFLTSSAPCVVVLAMSRRVIEQDLAMQFARVASALGPEALPGSGGAGLSPDQRYARAYLEKLVNVEVAVPPPADEKERLLYGAPVAAEPSRRAAVLGTLKVAWAALLVAFCAWGAWHTGTRLHPDVTAVVGWFRAPPPNGQAAARGGDARPAAAQGTTVATPSAEPGAGAPTTASTSVERVAERTPLDDPALAPPERAWVLPAEGRLPRTIVFAVALALGLAALVSAGRHRVATLDDSPQFRQALDVWHPVIRSAHPTPRALKRFLNRVRFTAMRSRPARTEPPPGRFAQARRATLRWLGLGEPEPPPGPGGDLPEPLLVALAALTAWSSELAAPEALRAVWAGTSGAGSAAVEKGGRTLGQVVEEHVKRFGAPIDPVAALAAFAHLREGVAVR